MKREASTQTDTENNPIKVKSHDLSIERNETDDNFSTAETNNIGDKGRQLQAGRNCHCHTRGKNILLDDLDPRIEYSKKIQRMLFPNIYTWNATSVLKPDPPTYKPVPLLPREILNDIFHKNPTYKLSYSCSFLKKKKYLFDIYIG